MILGYFDRGALPVHQPSSEFPATHRCKAARRTQDRPDGWRARHQREVCRGQQSYKVDDTCPLHVLPAAPAAILSQTIVPSTSRFISSFRREITGPISGTLLSATSPAAPPSSVIFGVASSSKNRFARGHSHMVRIHPRCGAWLTIPTPDLTCDAISGVLSWLATVPLLPPCALRGDNFADGTLITRDAAVPIASILSKTELGCFVRRFWQVVIKAAVWATL